MSKLVEVAQVRDTALFPFPISFRSCHKAIFFKKNYYYDYISVDIQGKGGEGGDEKSDRVKTTKMPEKVQLLRRLRGGSGASCSAASQPQSNSNGRILERRLHLQLQAHDLEVQVRQCHVQSLIGVLQN